VKRRLLSRISRAVDSTQGAGHETLDDLKDCVVQNLQRLFLAREDQSPASPGCGLPDLGHFFSKPSITLMAMADALKNMIETYEPRLSNVQVVCLSDFGEVPLVFEISADLKVDRTEVPFSTRTLMKSSTNVVVDSH